MGNYTRLFFILALGSMADVYLVYGSVDPYIRLISVLADVSGLG